MLVGEPVINPAPAKHFSLSPHNEPMSKAGGCALVLSVQHTFPLLLEIPTLIFFGNNSRTAGKNILRSVAQVIGSRIGM